ncbi:MAG: Outer membrane protein Imp, required for envelope biogenesis / Organic solvent tolerance protein precursor [uncultured Sulfurovum sp.]|uniref:Outer membrane protein Imp, required for envelope biogenesis / Organic solvent tolerance protein n=2 Tax=uncultured Sulfurovum sp. TaxID=269237 RepID=A0A6S6SBL0_9BACT|nr:MAG: Outer membrane protein Imp, required for envelope biogenesis / Organic solvent tolerance protein precursor [uncultured Sulfurovum sp.]
MLKPFSISFFSMVLLSVLLSGKDTVEVFSKSIVATHDHLVATGDVVLLYDGALVKAEKATYDKNASKLLFSGGVEMIRRDKTKVFSDELTIDTSTKSVDFKELLLTTEEDLWILANKAVKEGETYTITDSVLSSCNQNDPDWTIEFAEAAYRRDKEYMTLSEAKLSFYDVPIFYFPYIAFPTVNKRTTGLLFPSMKFSSTEGFSYQQPIYYAPQSNFDIELNPQIRTSRGYGAHATARFVDSNHSNGSFTLGYFKNNDSYTNEYDLNKEHYGFEFLYKSTDILPESDYWDKYKSGVYVNSTYLNDLEYLNLQQESASGLVASNLIESRLNAFVYDDNDYFGLYGRYYIDTTTQDNKETIQDLPTLHYHRFLSSIIKDNLFYTFDARVHNYTRVKGSRAHQTEFDLPITYYNSFFNDYLDFKLSENLYLSNVSFSNLNQQSKNYRYYRNFHTMELSSDLLKSYGEDTHTLHPSIVYVKPSFEKENPLTYENLNEEQKDLFVTQTQKESISTGVSQYYYNKDLDMNLFQRLAFVQYPDSNTLKKGNINNELGYTKDSLNIHSNIFYSLDQSELSSVATSLTYNQSNYDIMLTHFYNNGFLLNGDETSFVNGEVYYNFNEHNQGFANGSYDMAQNFSYQWHLGWEHRKKCWGIKFSVGQEQIPNFDTSYRNNVVYFELNLNPIGGISKSVEQEFASQGR